jgi:hypothetical protein
MQLNVLHIAVANNLSGLHYFYHILKQVETRVWNSTRHLIYLLYKSQFWPMAYFPTKAQSGNLPIGHARAVFFSFAKSAIGQQMTSGKEMELYIAAPAHWNITGIGKIATCYPGGFRPTTISSAIS